MLFLGNYLIVSVTTSCWWHVWRSSSPQVGSLTSQEVTQRPSFSVAPPCWPACSSSPLSQGSVAVAASSTPSVRLTNQTAPRRVWSFKKTPLDGRLDGRLELERQRRRLDRKLEPQFPQCRWGWVSFNVASVDACRWLAVTLTTLMADKCCFFF